MSEKEINNTYVVPLMMSLFTSSATAWLLTNGKDATMPAILAIVFGVALLIIFKYNLRKENNEKVNS
ncbi:hypothetical protein [Campylobacter curvus]|uniref:hypothetical protein n=1 Tax=Campylobacter curvus TaxID=200 RepID=UPI00146FF695|nr:hypothetical protein [Campylobacter curvus]